jgi:putative DNA primase/helicase
MVTSFSNTNRSTSALNQAHLKEWIEGSGVDEAIASLAIESLSASELNERIKPASPIQTGGWWCSGVNWRTGELMGNRYGQAKPDKPHSLGEGKKPAKYLTASGMEPDAIFVPMTDKDYWLNVYSDKSITRHWTEGVKKAGAGLSIGLAVIALTGVWNFGKDGQLAPIVKKWAQPGTHHKLLFDSDYLRKPECRAAIIKFARLLLAEGVASVKISSWDEEWKGMDDFIVANGGDAFKDVLANAQTIQRWEKQFSKQSEKKSKNKPPSPRRLGIEIAEEYQPLWAFHNEQKVWRIYNGKYWEDIEDEAFHQEVFNVIEARGIEWETPVYIDNTIRVLKDKLLIKKWVAFDRTRYIAFNNKVLDTQTGELLEHKSGYRFTSCLPYDYSVFRDASQDTIALLHQHCPNLYEFMMRAMDGDAKRVLKLLAIVNGALKFRFFDLQLFVHLVGKPGTGKGTFARIVEKVVGSANTKNSSLTALSEPTELAALVDKQVVLLPDERRQAGIEEVLKLTGGDKIRYREIYKKPGESYFYGLLMALSNSPIFAGDTTGLERRLCLVQFLNPIPKHLRSSTVEKLYETEISNLISVCLQISDSQVTSSLKGLGESEIPEFKQQEWLMKMQVNSIASWANENLIYDLDTSTPIGDCRKSETYDTKTLYGNYRDFCEASGVRQPFQLQTFSGALIDLCTDLLEWTVEKKRTKTGLQIKGLRLRLNWDGSVPRIDESFEAGVDRCRPGVDRCRPGVDPGVDLKPLPDKAGVDYVDQNPIVKEQKNCKIDSDENQKYKKREEEVYTSTPPSQDKGFGSTPRSTPVSTEPAPATEPSLPFEDDSSYSTYPHLVSKDPRAQRNEAEKIRQLLLAANTKDELAAIHDQWSTRYDWVWERMSSKERNKVDAVTKVEQLNLLDVKPQPKVEEEPQSQSRVPSQESPVEDEWLDPEELKNMALALESCESKETLALLRECWPPHALNKACKLLTPEKHEQIKRWVIEQRQSE